MININDITVISPTTQKGSNRDNFDGRKIKVAFYARVSTKKDSQLHSLQNQVEYYHGLIEKNDSWIFVGMYYDEGISATSVNKREGFNDLIKDALDGKIELIVTKSVTRFARNTIDAISTVRMLRNHNVEVYFEKDNIWTLSGESEFILTIISAIAQEESHTISENTKWGMRKKMQKGIGCLCFSRFLGYDSGLNGEYVINEREAKIVKRIYDDFVCGFSLSDICRFLELDGIKTVTGKSKWDRTTIISILSNEKYKGDCLLQKYYLSDFLEKKMKKNQGELPKYYIKNHHQAIIDNNTWELANKLLKMRNSYKRVCVSEGFYRGLILCETCEKKCRGICGKRIAHSNTKNRRIFYRCENRYKLKCDAPSIKEDVLNLVVYDTLSEYLLSGDKGSDATVSTLDISKCIEEMVVESRHSLILKLSDGQNKRIDLSAYMNDKRLNRSYSYIRPIYKRNKGDD